MARSKRFLAQVGTIAGVLLVGLSSCVSNTKSGVVPDAGKDATHSDAGKDATHGDAGKDVTHGDAGKDATHSDAGKDNSDAGQTCEASPGCTFDVFPDMQWHDARGTLDCYCKLTNGCPQTVADAEQQLAANTSGCPASGIGYNYVSRGCGYVEVGHAPGLWSVTWWFDAATGKLVAARSGSDTPDPPCNAVYYIGGTIPPDCPSATTCTLCTNLGDAGPPVCN